MALDVWLLPAGHLPYIEQAHLYEHVAALTWDGPFVVLKRYWGEIEDEYGRIEMTDTSEFKGESLAKLVSCLRMARVAVEQMPVSWCEHLGFADPEGRREPVTETVDRTSVLVLIDRLLDAGERGLREGKALLFFGD